MNMYGTIIPVTSGQVAERQGLEKGNPIIVIPGVMGSRLFSSATVFDKSTKVWDPEQNAKGVTGLSKRLKAPLYVRPFVNQNYDSIKNAEKDVRDYGREYGALDTYKELVEELCKIFPERKVFFYSYNWMESNAVSAKKLCDNINNLSEKKVDLVCHSMGGLVASKYYKEYGKDQRVEKVITCATPYEGAPKLINSIMNWDILGEGVVGKGSGTDLLLGLLGGMHKNIKSSFIGVAELTPTKNYVSKIPMQKMYYRYDAKNHRSDESGQNLTYDEYINRCEAIFNKKKEKENTYKKIQNFQNSLLNSNGYNALLEYENAYFILGINQKTIISIRFNQNNSDVNKRLYESDLEYEIFGDGTVPYLSSAIMEQIPTKLPFKKKSITFAADHTEIIKQEKTVNWIMDILKKGYSGQQEDKFIEHDYIVARAACPVDVTVLSGGELLTSKAGEATRAASYGRMDLIGKNNEIKMICMDARDDYDIVLEGTGKGTMDYSIRFFDKTGILKSESKFIGIPITENTVIHTGTNKESGIVLNIDSNGDGTIAKILTSPEGEQIPAINIKNKASIMPSMVEAPAEKSAGIKHGNNTIIPDNRKELLQRFVISLLHRINTLKDSSTEHKD